MKEKHPEEKEKKEKREFCNKDQVDYQSHV
jgi:hypothetical protein